MVELVRLAEGNHRWFNRLGGGEVIILSRDHPCVKNGLSLQSGKLQSARRAGSEWHEGGGGRIPPLTPSLMRFCCLITEQQGLMGESVAGRGGGGGGGGGGDVI